MGEIEEPVTHAAHEKMLNEVFGDMENTLVASKKAISEKCASTQPRTGATSYVGNIKIDDTLKSRQDLQLSFTLKEANQNGKVLEKLQPSV